jgi:selenocysteine-specific translation elongation factor
MLPHGGTGSVKSLQVMDDDVERAGAGDRVGIALRNAKEESLSGTCLIAHPAIEDKKTNTFRPLALESHTVSSLTLSISPFQKKRLDVGDVVHASIDLQFNVGRVEAVEGTTCTVRWETPLLQRVDDAPPVLIAQLDSKPRIMGSAQLQKVE